MSQTGAALPSDLSSATLEPQKKISLRSLFSSHDQTFRTLYITSMWFGNTFHTYGVAYFTPFIFRTLGFTATLSLLGGVVVSLFAVIGSTIMFSLVERVGRKPLAVTGFALLAVVDLGIALLSKHLVFPVLLTLFSLFQLFAWIGPAGLVDAGTQMIQSMSRGVRVEEGQQARRHIAAVDPVSPKLGACDNCRVATHSHARHLQLRR